MKSQWGVVVVLVNVLLVVVPSFWLLSSRHRPHHPMLTCHEITMGCCRRPRRRPIASSSLSLAVAKKSRWGVVVVLVNVVLVVVPLFSLSSSRHRPRRRPVGLVVVPSSSSSSSSSLAVAIVMPSKNDTLISPQPLLCNRQDGERKAGCVSEDEDKLARGKQAV